MKKIRIYLAEDHPAVRKKIAAFLGGAFDIVGTAFDGRTALEEIARQGPDIALMDISMPVMSGIDAAERLVKMQVKTKIIFLTVLDDPDFVNAALATGAVGYVVKPRMATDLIPAIHSVIEGHRFISPNTRARNLNEL